MIVALLVCMAVGAINGVFVSVMGVNSFVVTLGMLFTLEGLSLIISKGTPVATPGGQPPLGTFGKVFGGGTYSELIWAVAIVVLLQIALTFTRWGLYTVAIGSNKLAAAEAGVRTHLVMIRNYMLCSLTAGLVGIFEAVRSATVQPNPAGPNEILFLAVAADRRLGNGGGGPDRRAVPGRAEGRVDPPGGAGHLPALLHGTRRDRGDDGERVRGTRAQGDDQT